LAASPSEGKQKSLDRTLIWNQPHLDVRCRDRLGGALQRKLVLLVGGSFGRDLLVAMALSVSLRAFDDHVRLPVLIVVISLAAMIGDIAPVAGGIGVVEAGMILGLTAADVSEADATAAVFIQLLFSSYLPPIWGWATLVWMRKREYL
jgi:glycosyltransferase 2 family protein